MIVFKMIVFGVEDDFSGALEEAGQYLGGAGFSEALLAAAEDFRPAFRGPPGSTSLSMGTTNIGHEEALRAGPDPPGGDR